MVRTAFIQSASSCAWTLELAYISPSSLTSTKAAKDHGMAAGLIRLAVSAAAAAGEMSATPDGSWLKKKDIISSGCRPAGAMRIGRYELACSPGAAPGLAACQAAPQKF